MNVGRCLTNTVRRDPGPYFLSVSPHPKRVVTLPCEISVFKKIGIRDKYIYRVAIQISLQTTEAALDFRFDHFIVIILASGKSLQ